MRAVRWTLVGLVIVFAALAVATRGTGLSARREPLPGEAFLMFTALNWTIPAEYRGMSSPIDQTPDTLRAGMEHWADHCAVCHDNDGRGRTEVGRNLYPPAPDMQSPDTQGLSDGVLFYFIEEGIPFTGMPGWATGTPEGERDSWALVQFIRHLPDITPQELMEMEALNPRSAADIEQEQAIDDFLSGGQ
jgi:cytochrome c